MMTYIQFDLYSSDVTLRLVEVFSDFMGFSIAVLIVWRSI